MSTLGVACRSEADSADGTCIHGVVVFLVSLDVFTKFEASVFVVVDFPAGHEICWGVIVDCGIPRWKGIKPENGVANQSGKHSLRDVTKREHSVPASRSVLDCSNRPFNVADVIICPASLELWKPLSHFVKFRIRVYC